MHAMHVSVHFYILKACEDMRSIAKSEKEGLFVLTASAVAVLLEFLLDCASAEATPGDMIPLRSGELLGESSPVSSTSCIPARLSRLSSNEPLFMCVGETSFDEVADLSDVADEEFDDVADVTGDRGSGLAEAATASGSRTSHLVTPLSRMRAMFQSSFPLFVLFGAGRSGVDTA